eukprot:1271155-Prymnesium_polylepis.1
MSLFSSPGSISTTRRTLLDRRTPRLACCEEAKEVQLICNAVQSAQLSTSTSAFDVSAGAFARIVPMRWHVHRRRPQHSRRGCSDVRYSRWRGLDRRIAQREDYESHVSAVPGHYSAEQRDRKMRVHRTHADALMM